MAAIARAYREIDAARARMGAEIRMLQRQLARLIRLWRRKLRRKLWRGARAAIYHRTPAVVAIDAPELEDGFGNVDLDVVHDPPGKRSKFLPRRWTPPQCRTTQRRFTRQSTPTTVQQAHRQYHQQYHHLTHCVHLVQCRRRNRPHFNHLTFRQGTT
jgi:hypothetical protein